MEILNLTVTTLREFSDITNKTHSKFSITQSALDLLQTHIHSPEKVYELENIIERICWHFGASFLIARSFEEHSKLKSIKLDRLNQANIRLDCIFGVSIEDDDIASNLVVFIKAGKFFKGDFPRSYHQGMLFV